MVYVKVLLGAFQSGLQNNQHIYSIMQNTVFKLFINAVYIIVAGGGDPAISGIRAGRCSCSSKFTGLIKMHAMRGLAGL
jgi:hypothetical protein